MSQAVAPAEMLPQLESARRLALADAQVYTQVIPGILPIIGPGAPVDVRRWGADFLAEGFASPSLSQAQKEELVTDVVPVLKGMIEGVGGEDTLVVKSAVMAAGCIYPLVFRRVLFNGCCSVQHDASTSGVACDGYRACSQPLDRTECISRPDQVLLWQDMTAIKLNISRRMDTAPASVRICCVKFVQKVVQVQTPGLIADPRRPDHNETSLALVPRNHPLLPVANIEAETSGLTDRLLSVLQEQSGDPLMVDATMNCLAVLIKTRPPIANKILSVVLNFNPLKHAVLPLTPRKVVVLKSLERTTRALLKYVMRIIPNHPMGEKIHNYLQRLQQSRTALFSEAHSLKRPAEPTDALDDAKRQRLTQEPRSYPPMPPPPNTLAQLFTLTTDTTLQQFDVKLLPVEMVSNINGLLLQHIDSKTLDEAIEVVRQRYVHLQKLAQPTKSDVPMAGPTGIDDEDEYDPELIAGSDTAMAPATEKALEELAAPVIDLGSFELQKPAPLSSTEVAILSDQAVGRVFEVAASFDHIPVTNRQKSGLNRLAAGANDREAWITVLTRLATRAPSGLNDIVASKLEAEAVGAENSSILKKELASVMTDIDSLNVEKPDMSSRIRHTLFRYVLDDWRPRINIALSWLTEEWYADRLVSNASPLAQKDDVSDGELLPNYTRTLNRLLTQLLPRFDASDSKLLIRFLSELPHLNADILDQVRQLARDPGTVKICTLALQYLVLFRPPVREIVLDALSDIWVDGDEGVREAVGKVLNKWRPGFEADLTKTLSQPDPKEEEDNNDDDVDDDDEEEGEEEDEKDVDIRVNGTSNQDGENPQDGQIPEGNDEEDEEEEEYDPTSFNQQDYPASPPFANTAIANYNGDVNSEIISTGTDIEVASDPRKRI